MDYFTNILAKMPRGRGWSCVKAAAPLFQQVCYIITESDEKYDSGELVRFDITQCIPILVMHFQLAVWGAGSDRGDEDDIRTIR